MGIFGSIGGIIGAAKMKKASKKATKAQIAAMQKGITEQNQQWDATQGYYDPYMKAGTGALGQYGNLVGLGGAEQQQAAIDQLKNSPFYQSLYRTGEEAVLQNASATGGLRGGNTQRSLADFGADTLMQTIQQQLAQLSPLYQQGFAGAGQLGQFGQANANQVTNLLTGQGQAKAQDYLTRGGLSAGIWQGIGGLADTAASFIPGMPPGLFGAGGAGAAMGGMSAMPAILGSNMSSIGGFNLTGH